MMDLMNQNLDKIDNTVKFESRIEKRNSGSGGLNEIDLETNSNIDTLVAYPEPSQKQEVAAFK